MLLVFFDSLILGLISSLHCAGMCGPLVIAFPMKSKSNFNVYFGLMLYFSGKTLSYMLLGLVFGFIGLSVTTVSLMQWLSIITGIAFILFAWFNFMKLSLKNPFQSKITLLLGTMLKKLLKSNLPIQPFFLGFLNGFLPCGMVYMAIITSVLTFDPLMSMWSMMFFGLGTIPVLVIVKLFSERFSFKLNVWKPILLTLIGCMLILRGLNLGIPYLSPEIKTGDVSNIGGTVIECHDSTSVKK